MSKRLKKSKLPDFIFPMLSTLIAKPFNDENWLFEIKWDGYRALAFIENGKVTLKSRNNLILNDKFHLIVENLKTLKEKVILDGELVVLDSHGKPQFQLMQNYQRDRRGALYYYVFDILYKDSKDLRELPLIERKEILKRFIHESRLPFVRYSDHILAKGEAFFQLAVKEQLEGIIGKKLSSQYRSGRSKEWVKIKTSLRQEVVIGGFTAPRGTRKKFGALLVGVYDDKGNLHFSGAVGGGFTEALLDDVYKKLKPLIIHASPFSTKPKTSEAITWVKPQLVAEVAFSEWTEEQIMRQPIFKGLRIDKDPKSIKKEIPKKQPNKTSQVSNELNLTNLDKIYYPQEKITKGDLLSYYESVSDVILPYLKDRPIMLHRFPEGIHNEDFYQKDIGVNHAKWIKTFELKQENKINHYLMINNLPSLLYAINLGSIDLHPFLARYKKLEYPDFCVIDLDPHGVSFDKVIETALLYHSLLDQIEVKHFIKTSGGKGLHILIPLHAKYTFDQSRQFAEIISFYIHKQIPKLTSLERSPKKRENKIYLDCLQNRYGQSIVAPYSVRPRPGASVSTPLLWDEVNEQLDPSSFTIKTVPERIKKKGDILRPILGPGISIRNALAKLKN